MTTAEEQLVSEMIKMNQRLGRLIDLLEQFMKLHNKIYMEKRGF